MFFFLLAAQTSSPISETDVVLLLLVIVVVTSEPEHLNAQHVFGVYDVRAQMFEIESFCPHERLSGTVGILAKNVVKFTHI